MAYPDTKISCVKNIWARQMHFKNIGDQNEGHIHNYDHLTLLAKGKVRVHVDGVVSEFTAPHMIFIQAGKSHYIEALEDDTVAYCVHAVRDRDTQDIIDPSQIPDGINVPGIIRADF